MQKKAVGLIDSTTSNNLLQLISSPLTNINDFMYEVLEFISDTFGHERLAFFLVDESSKLKYTSKTSNVSEKSFKSYGDYFYKVDVFNPDNNQLLINSNRNVVTIPDIMPFKLFEKTEYYNEYLSKYDYYYYLSTYFRSKNQILGGFSVARSKEEGNFAEKDIQVLDKIAPYISNCLVNYLEVNQLKLERELYQNSIQDAPHGIIILNNRSVVVSYNGAARSLCESMLGDYQTDPVHTFVEQFVGRSPNKAANVSVSINIGQKRYDIEITPSKVFNSNLDLDTYFVVYINKSDHDHPDNNFLLASTYHLTSREIEIVDLMSNGLSNSEIADILIISKNTVRTHIENIRVKVDAKNRLNVLKKLGKLK